MRIRPCGIMYSFSRKQQFIRNAFYYGNMREIKKQATAAERHVRNEEKKIRSREQEMARNLKLIGKIQDSVAA